MLRICDIFKTLFLPERTGKTGNGHWKTFEHMCRKPVTTKNDLFKLNSKQFLKQNSISSVAGGSNQSNFKAHTLIFYEKAHSNYYTFMIFSQTT